MSTRMSFGAGLVCAGVLATVGCGFGGSNANLSAGKIQAAHKVALVSVCVQKPLGAVKGTKNFGAFEGNGAKMLLPPLVAALNASLPAQWKGVEVVPLAEGAAASDRPGSEHRECANGQDGMMAGGFMGDPDLAYLGGLATKMGVDAVLAISGNPIIRLWDGKGGKAYVASVGDGVQLHLVDRTGERIAFVHLRDFETEYTVAPGSKDSADATKIGESLGKLIASGFVAIVKGGEFNPPSRPGLSGI
jgi:hypothetical protein